MKRLKTTSALAAILIVLLTIAMAGAQPLPQIEVLDRLGHHNLGQPGADTTLGAVVNFAGTYILHQRSDQQVLTQLSLDGKIVKNRWMSENGRLVKLAGDWDGKLYLAAIVAANKTFGLIDQVGHSLSVYNPGPNAAVIVCTIDDEGRIHLFVNSSFGQLLTGISAMTVVENGHLALAVKQGRASTIVFYDANGLSVWAQGFIGTGEVWPDFISISRVSGDVIVSGRASGLIVFGSDTARFDIGDSFVWRLSTNKVSRGLVVLRKATLAGIVSNNSNNTLHCGGNAQVSASIAASGKTFSLQPGAFFLRLDGTAVYALVSGQVGVVHAVQSGYHGETWLGGYVGDRNTGDWFLAAYSNGTSDAREVFRLERQSIGFQSIEMLARRDDSLYTIASFDSTFRFGPSLILSENGRGGDVLASAYRIRYGGTTSVTDRTDASAPIDFKLEQNYPNPFNPSTTIEFNVPRAVPASLKIFNLSGQLVREFQIAMGEARRESILWDGMNHDGQPVATGMYIYKLEAGSAVLSRSMQLVK